MNSHRVNTVVVLLGYRSRFNPHGMVALVRMFLSERSIVRLCVLDPSCRNNLDWTFEEAKADFKALDVSISSLSGGTNLFREHIESADIIVTTVSKSLYRLIDQNTLPHDIFYINIDTYTGDEYRPLGATIECPKCEFPVLKSRKALSPLGRPIRVLIGGVFCYMQSTKVAIVGEPKIGLFLKNRHTLERKVRKWFKVGSIAKRYLELYDDAIHRLEALIGENPSLFVLFQHPSALPKESESEAAHYKRLGVDVGIKSLETVGRLSIGVGINSTSAIDCNRLGVPFLYLDHPATYAMPARYRHARNYGVLETLFDLLSLVTNLRILRRVGVMENNFFGDYGWPVLAAYRHGVNKGSIPVERQLRSNDISIAPLLALIKLLMRAHKH